MSKKLGSLIERSFSLKLNPLIALFFIYLIAIFCFRLTHTQTIAAAIVIGVILHAGNHLACDFPRLVNSSDKDYKAYLVNDFGGNKPSYAKLARGTEGVTGILMVICMAIAFTLATRWFRRNLIKLPKPFDRLTGFNAFWYSHHLFVIVYVLLIIHGVVLYLVHKWYLKTVRLGEKKLR